MKSIGDCLAALVKVGQIDKKTAEQAQKLFDDIKAGTAGAAGSASAEANAALRAAEAMKRAAEDKKFQAVLNARTLDEATKRVMADPHSRAVGAAQIFQRFEVSAKSGGVNIASRQEDLFGQITKPFAEAMERYGSRLAGLKKDLIGPRNMVRELFGVDTGDQIAKAAADGWNKANAVAVALAKQAGKVFTAADDWRVPQFWSTMRVRGLGKAAFLSDIRAELASGGLALRDPMTGAIAQGARAAEILDTAASKIWVGSGSEGPGSAGAFNNEMRVFTFADGAKGADAWLRLQGKYGGGQDIMQTMTGHMHNQAGEVALMDVLGPSHRANFNAVMRLVDEERAAQQLKTSFSAKVKTVLSSPMKSLRDSIAGLVATPTGLRRLYDTATGGADAVDGELWGGVFGAIKHLHIAANMGSAIVSSIAPDSTLAMLAAHHIGLEPVRLLQRIMGEFRDGIAGGDGESKAQLAQMAIAAHSAIDQALNVSKYAGDTGVAEALSKVSNFVIRAQGLHVWDEALKRAFTLEFHGYAARQMSTAFDALDKPFRAFLDRNNFTPAEWDAIRSDGKVMDIDGAKFLDPSSIADRQLQARFKSAFLDERRMATPTPSLMERSFVANMKRGTFWGELTRSMMMYKSFPMWMLLTHVARGARLAVEGSGGYMAAMFAGLTLAGAAGLEAKQLLKGNDPLPLDRLSTWGMAAAQGGGLGIYGDFINDAFSRSGSNLAGTIAGPAVGFGQDILNLTSQNARKLVDGDKASWQGELTRFIKNWTPGSSLWYSRLATDRLVWDQFQKMIDPEYSASFQRVRDKMMNDMGQRMWWDKGATAPTRGPDMGKMWQ